MRRKRARHLSARRLDLDDPRAEIAENLARIGPGQELGEIEDKTARQRPVRPSGRRNRGQVASTCTAQAPW
jgi:hypothetical protein